MVIESEDVSKMDILMSQLQNQGKSEYSGGVKGITVRLPVLQFAAIEALSRHSGMSKNKVMVELLDVVIATAVEALDRPNRKAFNKLQSEVLAQLADEGFEVAGKGEV